jgi:hypothetical protein
LKDYIGESVFRLDVKELIKKITFRHATDLGNYFPELLPTRIAMVMDDEEIVNKVFPQSAEDQNLVGIGHPNGIISIEVDVDNKPSGPELKLAATRSTSCRIMEGYMYVPARLFDR